MFKIPSRQIHLDFHTSQAIPDVGAKFDRKQWQAALKAGQVNSINVFAKCHHSWSYYPTKVGFVHPTLSRNLLGEQIDACHEINVNCPIYYTIGWSSGDALRHPDWVALDRQGQPQRNSFVKPEHKPTDPFPNCAWDFMCPSGPYLDHMVAQSEEICRMFPVDGFWYDICCCVVCYCDRCRQAMRDAGLDAENPADAKIQHGRTWRNAMARLSEAVKASHPQASIFFNGGPKNGCGNMYSDEFHAYATHYDLEDLPTTWGGYDRFPIRSRFFSMLGKPFTAMSGKFHTSWGEFGGFKHADALRYEASAMIAFGARCNFGDHLHPSGQMEMATYRNVGQAYRYVRKIEAYGLDAQPAANLGLMLSGSEANHDQGVANMLLESQLDFRVVRDGNDLAGLDAIILTGNVRLDETMAQKLNQYAADGGSLLVLGTSGLDAEGKRFLLDVGAKYIGPGQFDLDYLLPGKALAKELPAAPFLCYQPAVQVRVTDGTVLAAIREPYFSRTFEHYCGHLNTPFVPEDAPHPGAVQKGRVIYLPHFLGEMYHVHAARTHRQFFINALRRIYRRPNFQVSLPSAGRVSFVRQQAKNRYVGHLLYGPPLPRGRCQLIEDLVPLHDVPIEISVPEKIRGAYLAPQGRKLRLTRSGNRVKVTVPEVQCHQAVVFEY